MSGSRHVQWLLLLLFFFLIFDAIIATCISSAESEIGGVVLGLSFAQITVAAVWTALGPHGLFFRAASGLVVSALAALSLYWCLRHVGSDAEGVMLAGVALSLWVTIQVPLWVLRLTMGWRLQYWHEGDDETDSDTWRYGIRQLFIWTALVAVTLGVGRLVVPRELSDIWNSPREALAIFVVLTLFNALLALPMMWATFAHSRMHLWMIVAIFCGIALTIAEITVFKAAMGPIPDDDIFWNMNAIQSVGAVVGLLLLRAGGLRLNYRRASPRST